MRDGIGVGGISVHGIAGGAGADERNPVVFVDASDVRMTVEHRLTARFFGIEGERKQIAFYGIFVSVRDKYAHAVVFYDLFAAETGRIAVSVNGNEIAVK